MTADMREEGDIAIR